MKRRTAPVNRDYESRLKTQVIHIPSRNSEPALTDGLVISDLDIFYYLHMKKRHSYSFLGGSFFSLNTRLPMKPPNAPSPSESPAIGSAIMTKIARTTLMSEKAPGWRTIASIIIMARGMRKPKIKPFLTPPEMTPMTTGVAKISTSC